MQNFEKEVPKRYYYLIGSWRGLRLQSKAPDPNHLIQKVSGGQSGKLNVQSLAQDLNLEL